MLGRDLAEVLAAEHDLLAWDRAGADITDGAALRERVAAARPEVVINTAAATDVDRCEREPEWAYTVNGEGARNAAEAARAARAAFLHVSTDFVFSGETDGEYSETGPTDGPVNVYGASKLAGEQAVLEVYPDAKIARTEWLYGRHGRSFPRAILNAALADPSRELRVVADQWGAPTYTRHVARALSALLRTPATGVFHVTNAGCCSRYDWAVELLRRAELDPARVRPITAAEWPAPARRPRRTVLSGGRLPAAGVEPLADWRDAVAEWVEELWSAGELRRAPTV